MPRRRHGRGMERDSSSPSAAPSISSDAQSQVQTITSIDVSGYSHPVPSSMDDSEEEEEGLLAQTRLIIAVDYGTTYTGVAYATPRGNNYTLGDIEHVTDWGDGMGNLDKVPSVISYSEPSPKQEQQWGRSISPNAITMVHTKLELDVHNTSEELDFILQSLDGMENLHFQHVKSQGNSPAYTYKTPEQIVTDYLSKVFQYLEDDVAKFSMAFREQAETDLVITVPTEWLASDRAMNSTYRALTAAGFNLESFPRLNEVIFVTEPEAAAQYTARFVKDTIGYEFLKEGSYFILCDAGGGTVDVVSYKVKKVFPILELEQIGFPTARRCGSQFINFEFKKWLQKLIGEKNYKAIDPNTVMGKITSHVAEGKAMRDLMRKFDFRKKLFTGLEDDVIRLDLSSPLDTLNIQGKVDEGDFMLPIKDMENFFDVCVGQIIDLIKGHFFQIEQRGSKPKNIFLVGGFGESPYLQRQVEETFKRWRVDVRRPKTSWTAVVQGGVICGIEKESQSNLAKATSCRHSYGIRVAEPFSDIYHDRRDEKVNDISGARMAEGQLLWMLNIGDLILSSRPYKKQQNIAVAFTKDEEKRGQISIYRSSEPLADRPTQFRNSWADLYTACAIDYDLSKFSWNEFEPVGRKNNLKAATLTLELSLDGVDLEASVRWKGQVVGSVDDINY